MDGVLVDSEFLHEKAQDIVCKQYELEVPKSLSSMFKGWTEERVYEHIVTHYGKNSATVEELVRAKHATYASLADELVLLPGALHLVQFVHELGLPLGLVTSATRADQRRTFEKFGLAPYFSSVVTVEDVAFPKPAPQPYQMGAAGLGFPPQECLAIEDSIYGILSAMRAGCHVFGVATTFSHDVLQEVDAHAIFHSLEKIEIHLKTFLAPASD